MPTDLDELVRQWGEAERRLYPMVLSDPGGYELSVRAARLLADELSEVATLESLAVAWPSGPRRAARQLDQLGGGGTGVAEYVAGAAFAIRHRELAAATSAAERSRRVADAASRGDQWVVVDQVGRPELARFGHFRRLEMHLPDGMGIYSYAEEQADSDAPLLIVERLPLDPASGLPHGDVAERREAADPASWEAAQSELREAIAGLDTIGKPGGG